MSNVQVKDIKATLPQDLPPTKDLGWMTEAKDWAGELISGQSTTGRILVSLFHKFLSIRLNFIFIETFFLKNDYFLSNY